MEKFYLFEKGESKVAIFLADWGSGDSWNAVFVYAFDGLRQQWVPQVVWDTETRDVKAVFDRSSGVIEVLSGKGAVIFRTNISAFPARGTRDW